MPSALDALKSSEGRKRAIIDKVRPQIDCGRFPIKRVLGEVVKVEADIFADGHDALSAVLKFRHSSTAHWREVRMTQDVNDLWYAEFEVRELGVYFYTVEAWVDRFKTWRIDLQKKVKAGQDVSVELSAGAEMIGAAAEHAEGDDRRALEDAAGLLAHPDYPEDIRVERGVNQRLAEMMYKYQERPSPVEYEKQLRVTVDPILARCSAWYEFFPRSCASQPGRHGTFRDCEAFLERIADMGFDIAYLPPIHPVGFTMRKGKNNAVHAQADDPGSPWGIGSDEGGFKAIHPMLGTLEDFRRLVAKADELGIQIALDIAFQCSPDHPYVREHPEWFLKRADGSIQYAENPPKKYQDIYPLYFETDAWRGLWKELKSVFEFWIDQGITIFRVDNPHTKCFAFWEWVINELKSDHPELIFLSEAFTRPKVLNRLAKLGFTQSYNYFPWRNTKLELTEYLTELTHSEVREYLRPNLWPNTPDILTAYLQYGGRPAFVIRFILAATLGASYGIYGPAFELCENKAREPGSEEYLNAEKYEIRQWNLEAEDNISDLIALVNRIRKENPALQTNDTLEFVPVENEFLLAYYKVAPDETNAILTVVNLDPHHTQIGWTQLPLEELGINPHDTFQVHDLLTNARYLWNGPRNYIELNPEFAPAHIFRIRRRTRKEQDFDYFM